MLSVSCIAFMVQLPQPVNEVPYPEGYRKWTHIKTSIIGPQTPSFKLNGGFHHIPQLTFNIEAYIQMIYLIKTAIIIYITLNYNSSFSPSSSSTSSSLISSSAYIKF
jgi:hypothetical protein